MNRLKQPTEIITLDNTKIIVEAADLDGDGDVGGVERIRQSYDTGIQPVLQPTELGETLQELNRDEVDPLTRQSGIDLKARLHPMEVKSIGALDSLVGFRIVPSQCLAFTRQMKRLSVSQNGLGRREFVEVVSGKKEQDARLSGGGVGERVKGIMGLGGR